MRPDVGFDDVSESQKYNRQLASLVNGFLGCESCFQQMMEPLPARLPVGGKAMYVYDENSKSGGERPKIFGFELPFLIRGKIVRNPEA